ncbi:universal stress protein [Streptomyces sp. CNQ-509]|uniref:universal stress protein n=1 Tax=unclassified Streptomyces TaxID=2593676 RepID=UPI00062DD5DF|nr:universal stress protein [Streptomyces sp. CNQ-509]AKH85779.1 universal stress protein [Streptomyces sp. CNQ-509]
MEHPVVVGTDGSLHSLRAIDLAADEAARHGVPLRVVFASLWERYESMVPDIRGGERPPFEILADDIAGSGEERARRRQPDLKVTSRVLSDEPDTALTEESHQAFAVVTGSRGRGGAASLLLGSVSLAVAARATCPVIVVRGDEETWDDRSRPVVLGVSELAEGQAATEFAFREAAARHSPLLAVRAWRCPVFEPGGHLGHGSVALYEEKASAVVSDVLDEPRRTHPDVGVQRRLAEGPAHHVLMGASAEAGLVVLGAPRRRGHAGLQLGRVTHALLHSSTCPVAVVPERH